MTDRGYHNPTDCSWKNMKQRTCNPNNKAAKNYSGRGIDIDPRWMSFDMFLSDMGDKPSGLSLDRIDNDRGYWPDNCRWATRAVQNTNTRRTIRVTMGGERLVLKDALARLGYSYQALRYLRDRYSASEQQIVDAWIARGFRKCGNPFAEISA